LSPLIEKKREKGKKGGSHGKEKNEQLPPLQIKGKGEEGGGKGEKKK